MLASPMPKDGIRNPSEWVAEEKYDGHRLIVDVAENVPTIGSTLISAFSRDGNPRALPRHIRNALSRMPAGIYDGELIVPGFRSYGVTEKLNESKLVLVLFDVLHIDGHSVTSIPCTCSEHFGFASRNWNYDERRYQLADILKLYGNESLQMATAYVIRCQEDINLYCRVVWDRDGEGLILKKKSGLYAPGKRSRDWVKIKACASAVLTVTGFEAGKLGPQSKVRLRDDEGNETTVKTKNDAMRERFRLNPASQIGRRLRIEFQERTPDGSYRHPRFDRFEDE